jgi:hypothetical protein
LLVTEGLDQLGVGAAFGAGELDEHAASIAQQPQLRHYKAFMQLPLQNFRKNVHKSLIHMETASPKCEIGILVSNSGARRKG